MTTGMPLLVAQHIEQGKFEWLIGIEGDASNSKSAGEIGEFLLVGLETFEVSIASRGGIDIHFAAGFEIANHGWLFEF